VKVTFNIPKEAAEKLARLAEQGDEALRELGILSIQVEGGRVSALPRFNRYETAFSSEHISLFLWVPVPYSILLFSASIHVPLA
jgi:hypothetical protein